MKPLELHIYDKHPDTDAYRVGGFYSPYCLVSRDKRLTEADLSAEYWRAGWIAESERTRESDQVARTFYRFATLPHYDEADQ